MSESEPRTTEEKGTEGILEKIMAEVAKDLERRLQEAGCGEEVEVGLMEVPAEKADAFHELATAVVEKVEETREEVQADFDNKVGYWKRGYLNLRVRNPGLDNYTALCGMACAAHELAGLLLDEADFGRFRKIVIETWVKATHAIQEDERDRYASLMEAFDGFQKLFARK